MTCKQLIAIAALAFAPATACTAPQDADPAIDTVAVEEEVRQSIDRTVAAFLNRDVDGATEHLADEYVGMFHGQPNILGKAAEIEVTKTQVADPALNLTVSNEEVEVAEAGDMAIYTATYSYNFTDPETEEPSTETGNWILVYKRQADGKMKATTGVVTDTPAG